ncbi:MAG: hypothetical protein JEZ09_16660 [Salinivirgaceae bacterium]|nr:hypothetical protein [Salinivirgaceae bacterium]
MKRIYTIIIAVLLTATLWAQSPEKMSYQAVIRNASDQLVTSQAIGMQISILQGSASGTEVYVETQTPITNANGLVSLEIGAGTTSGDFSAIDWSSGIYFIKTETDPTGGTNYTITGTSQLLSVPYALYAKASGSSVAGPQGEQGETGAAGADGIDGINGTDGLTTSVNGVTQVAGAITLTKANIELSNVDNTADAAKPVSTATQTALDAKVDKDGTKGLSANDFTDTDKANVDVNTAKTGITSAQADKITANTLKVGYTEALVSANTDVAANTVKISAATGTQAGQMQYWDGTEWLTVSAGTQGQVLTFINGVPAWIASGIDVGETDAYNPTTGKVWMDRNLGATQVATSSTDAAAYGDLYQWGRGTDGHQIRTSVTTATLSSSDTPGHAEFITISNSPFDWRSTQNDNLWQGVNGVNNPCPAGYRIPTETEFDAERLSWSENNSIGAFASPLKLAVAGCRDGSNGSLSTVGSFGSYWSSTESNTYSCSLTFYSNGAYTSIGIRAGGFSVRCIKD